MIYGVDYNKDTIGPCIEWPGAKDSGGYGVTRSPITKKQTSAHRAEWEKHNGAIPEDMVIAHKCDNRACYRIEHLFLATQAENLTDAHLKGRLLKLRKLTEQQVTDAITMYENGDTYQAIANRFRACKNNIAKHCQTKSKIYGQRKAGRPSPRRLTTDEIKALLEMRAAGNTLQAIANKLGITRQSVHRQCNKHDSECDCDECAYTRSKQ